MTDDESRAYMRGYNAALRAVAPKAHPPSEYVGTVGVIVAGHIVRARITRDGARVYRAEKEKS